MVFNLPSGAWKAFLWNWTMLCVIYPVNVLKSAWEAFFGFAYDMFRELALLLILTLQKTASTGTYLEGVKLAEHVDV